LAKRGIACFLLYLAFHSSRLPEIVRNRLPDLTAEEWFSGYQMSVVDIRQIIDWAITEEGISRERIAVIGLSLGGIISAIAMAVDERIKAGVLMVTGGNSEKIVQTSRISAFRKHYKHSKAEYNEIQERYLRYLAEVAKRGLENVEPDTNSFLTDPMTFAHLLRQRPLLMINAHWDEFIPKEATLDFWEACDKPSISWYPATHSSVWLWYPLILRQILGFIKSTFKP
jgi:esterase/lipase